MYVRINTAIKRLLLFSSICIVILLLFILLQSFFGKYGDNSGTAWVWLLMHVLPLTVLLYFTFLKNRPVAVQYALHEPVIFRIGFYFIIVYMVALIAVLLLQPFADPEKTEAQNLHATDMGLLIFQFLVGALLGIFMYRAYRLEQSENVHELVYDGADRVFISYNHNNKGPADQIKSLLEKEDIQVVMDTDGMLGGEDIKDFIVKSVISTNTTLSIISETSLLSGWVSLETVNTFYLEKFSKKKRFIAAYLDEEFFKIDFAATATRKIDARLETIKNQVQEHDRLGIDSRDLNEEKTRLLSLRYNMDEILKRLRNSKCIDIREQKMQESFPLLLKSIKNV